MFFCLCKSGLTDSALEGIILSSGFLKMISSKVNVYWIPDYAGENKHKSEFDLIKKVCVLPTAHVLRILF